VSKKIGTPYLFVQPLKLATSNLVYNLGLGSSLLRNNFYDQNWWGSELGEYPKNWDSLFISATVEASNFKFGIQFGLVEELAKKQLLRPKLAGVRAREASKEFGTPIYFCNR